MTEPTEPQPLDTGNTMVQAKPISEVPTGKAKAKSKYGRKAGKTSDKMADRTHRALEKQFSQAQRLSTEQDYIPPGASPPETHVPFTSGVWSPLSAIQQVSDQTFGQVGPPMLGEDLDLPGPSSVPTATLIPTAAGSRPLLEPSFSTQLQSWISQAVIQAMASSGIHQASPVPGPSSAPASSSRPTADRSGRSSTSRSPMASVDRLALERHTLTQESYLSGVMDMIQAARRPSTNRIYNHTWKNFCHWCDRNHVSLSQVTIPKVLEYLLEGVNKGLSPTLSIDS
ncbi:uncharacterized protein LOC120313406 [Crotalus tigris]|uniref:uncharacterized protein LOC120313406 n=1 Tax=Crotalus tigris TaxID=88082 RepID=UPI00192F7EED|nr:uncharacterized protein LOC120313406 [Crotalus tigris]